MTTSARDALWLIFILIVVGVIWSFSGKGIGGFDFSNLGSGPRLSPKESSETISEPYAIFQGGGKQPSETMQIKTSSGTTNLALTINAPSAQETNPQKEYIYLRNSGQTSINLSELKLKNKNNEEVQIGLDENGKQIVLFPGESTYILTGKTTKGANFKINKCSGYFNQFHKFTPSISSNCEPISSLPETRNLDDQCLSYIPQIRYCQTPTSLPTNLSSSCQQFIQQHTNYSGCVKDFKNDRDFDKREWRIFLNRTTEFWAKRNETIKLVNQKTGQTVFEAIY